VVVLVSRSISAAEILKYKTLLNADPSAAVELNVRVCQPDSRPDGIVAVVLTDPPTALPDAMVCGFDRTTRENGAVS
jgi:hypothetical protein